MKIYFFLFVLIATSAGAQTPKSFSTADILQQLKKLPVFGSVLYVAAHPDDENTRLLAYLANEKHYRTGYLSLTRGDGGQNLIGDEQGIDLGLIRTQELLSARRIDGAEQFFSRAYDFGFSKNPEEALRIWDHDKILSDVVWVIRKFRPDVIITRFPTTGEGGHGHHTASAILAGEAFDAAADPTKFPEQLKFVKVWQAKRLLWNTFNFGGTNTTREDQFQIDCGVYNPILGKSYGEIAAESRSRHKSQGFGVPAQRGSSIEYFSTIKGSHPVNDLLDAVDFTSARSGLDAGSILIALQKNFNPATPALLMPQIVTACSVVDSIPDPFWRAIKSAELRDIAEACSGIYLEAAAVNSVNFNGDSMRLRLTAINRSGLNIDQLSATVGDNQLTFPVTPNANTVLPASYALPVRGPGTQPYWLSETLSGGAFTTRDQEDIGKPENLKPGVSFQMRYGGRNFVFQKPVLYKFTDPVKGEIYEPISVVPAVTVSILPAVLLMSTKTNSPQTVEISLDASLPVNSRGQLILQAGDKRIVVADTVFTLARGVHKIYKYSFGNNELPAGSVSVSASLQLGGINYNTATRNIRYDHIPVVNYQYPMRSRILSADIKIAGAKVGYIAGAGDKVPEALTQMGYAVTMLSKENITTEYLKQFDAIVTGVRAYNVHSWLSDAYATLMNYVQQGGTLVVQYNTNNSIGPVKAAISPLPFNISRSRVTDEEAKVNFLLPDDPILNYPNKITQKDFEGWIQERSIYNAENVDPAFRKIISMKDPGEAGQEGALIAADYGRGKFVYTGLVFFRELPAGVPGSYRLFANIIAGRK